MVGGGVTWVVDAWLVSIDHHHPVHPPVLVLVLVLVGVKAERGGGAERQGAVRGGERGRAYESSRESACGCVCVVCGCVVMCVW